MKNIEEVNKARAFEQLYNEALSDDAIKERLKKIYPELRNLAGHLLDVFIDDIEEQVIQFYKSAQRLLINKKCYDENVKHPLCCTCENLEDTKSSRYCKKYPDIWANIIQLSGELNSEFIDQYFCWNWCIKCCPDFKYDIKRRI